MRSATPLKRKITAILAADVAEYTRLISEDEEETLTRLEAYRRVFDDFVHRAGGRIFNTAGDGVMCEFASAVEATRCAIDIQESLRTANMPIAPGRQMHFRIGISIGDVVERDGDLLGDGVNIAARLQALADPGSICVSRHVHEAVMNKVSVPFRDLGNREVKNLPHPVHAFQIEMGPHEKPPLAGSPHPASQPAKSGERGIPAGSGGVPAGWIAAAALIVAIGAGGYVFLHRGETPNPVADKREMPKPAETPKQLAASDQTKPDLSKPDSPKPDSPKPAQQSVIVTESLSPAEAFEKLAKSGGIVKEAKTAPELYHNARSFEQRGESAAARRDYLALAALETDHIDPLMRLAALVRTQDGRAGAREIFAELSKGKGRAAALVHILQFDGAERQSRLQAFAEANPDYAPVHALIAQEFGEDRQNGQTINDRRQELAALKRFLLAERDGKVVPFFLDQSLLAQWIERAQKREKLVSDFFATNRDRIGLSFMRSNQGWMGNISVPEAASAIEYKFGDMPDFKATGQLAVLDPRTGKPMANPGFEMAGTQGPVDIALRYLDANGIRSTVTTLPFDPRDALIKAQRGILEQTSTSWFQFGKDHNAGYLYYSQLLSFRCAIAKVEFGLDGEQPVNALKLPPCDERDPHAIPHNAQIFLRVSPEIKTASVRLTFVGGDVSEVKTYNRP
jgi:class 3 adenylate cyclase